MQPVEHAVGDRHVQHRLAEQIALARKLLRQRIDVRQDSDLTVAKAFVLHREREDDVDVVEGLGKRLVVERVADVEREAVADTFFLRSLSRRLDRLGRQIDADAGAIRAALDPLNQELAGAAAEVGDLLRAFAREHSEWNHVHERGSVELRSNGGIAA